MKNLEKLDLEKNRELTSRSVRFDDLVEIYPAFGRKKEIELKRTRFSFSMKRGADFEMENQNFIFNQVNEKKYEFQIDLVKGVSNRNAEDVGRFFLRVLGCDPVKLNGLPVYQAFLSRGDELSFGYNKLVFKARSVKILEEEKIPFEKNIVESNLPLLLEGETGCGKTYNAKLIHEKSNVVGHFIHINLSSFSESLIESELFGHVKGSFTGASQDKLGALREANGGTLFLDEIDSLPMDIQTKLLLFLDSGVIRPVGSTREYKSRVRLICASGRSLRDLVDQKKMRKDFYFRISSGFSFSMKSLRESPEKIESLCQKFSHNHSVFIPPKLIKFYQSQSWPGNIRQFISHLEKKKILSQSSQFSFDSVDEALLNRDVFIDESIRKEGYQSLENVKEDYCIKVYIESSGRINDCSKILGISPNTIRSILRKRKLIGK